VKADTEFSDDSIEQAAAEGNAFQPDSLEIKDAAVVQSVEVQDEADSEQAAAPVLAEEDLTAGAIETRTEEELVLEEAVVLEAVTEAELATDIEREGAVANEIEPEIAAVDAKHSTAEPAIETAVAAALESAAPEAEPVPEPQDVAEIVTPVSTVLTSMEPEATPNPEPEVKIDLEPEVMAAPEATLAQEPEVPATLEAETTAVPETTSATELVETKVPEPEVTPIPQPEATPAPQPEPATAAQAVVEEEMEVQTKLELAAEPESGGQEPIHKQDPEPVIRAVEIKLNSPPEPEMTAPAPEAEPVGDEIRAEQPEPELKPEVEADFVPAAKKTEFSEFHTSAVQERVRVNDDGEERIKEEVQASESKLMTTESKETKEIIDDGDVQVTSVKTSEATRTVSRGRQTTTTTTTQVLTSDDLDSKILKEILNFDQTDGGGATVQPTGEDFINQWGKVVSVLVVVAALLFSLISFFD